VARTTDAEIKELVDTDKDVGWAVEAATVLVDEHLVGIGISDSMLQRIELFIGAHLAELASAGAGIIRESTGVSSTTWANIYGEGFRATRWGQQALALDFTGTLVGLTSTKHKAELKLV
jgi:hypothetical protein